MILPNTKPCPADCNDFPNIKYPVNGKMIYEINT